MNCLPVLRPQASARPRENSLRPPGRRRFSRLVPLAVALLVLPAGLHATVADNLLAKIQQSEFKFPHSDSNAPFLAVAWVNATYYSDSSVKLKTGQVSFKVWSENQSLIAPVWVGQKDMVLVGEYGSWQQIQIEKPNPSRLNLTTFVPLLAWARQLDSKTQGALFVAPNFVQGGEYLGYSLKQTSVYAGAVALHWNSPRFAWAGGLIGIAENGDTLWLPYLGAIWKPTSQFSLSLVAPWPTLTYAPSTRYMFQLGLSPAGAALGGSRDGQKLKVGFTSWNLMFSAHRQVTKSLWLSAGAGWSGFGSFTLTSEGEAELKHKLDRGPVFSVKLSVRPPTSSTLALGAGM